MSEKTLTLREAAAEITTGATFDYRTESFCINERMMKNLAAALAADEDDSWIDDAIDDATDSNEPLDEVIKKHYRNRGKA